eukprot:GGOE01060802.1.p1 GENE.GGOE01060802.1~~GGOE01060802.1.p1  ORF type:complete len:157 (+),score=34.29 GGOE01060802.1:58-528(+)
MPRPLPLGVLRFDAAYILSQIITMQCLYYCGLAINLFIIDMILREPLSLSQFFSTEGVSFTKLSGWAIIISYVLAAVESGGFLYLVVERSKKCLDFTLTLFVLHFLACVAVYGFPVNVEWWLLIVLSTAIMTLSGEWLCMKRELQEISLMGVDGAS